MVYLTILKHFISEGSPFYRSKLIAVMPASAIYTWKHIIIYNFPIKIEITTAGYYVACRIWIQIRLTWNFVFAKPHTPIKHIWTVFIPNVLLCSTCEIVYLTISLDTQ